jgi:hypothetical protein
MKVSRGTAAYYGLTEFKSSSYEQCDQVTKPRDHSYAWRYARSRRSCPLHRWLVDDAGHRNRGGRSYQGIVVIYASRLPLPPSQARRRAVLQCRL